ncbi:hypothetical protein E6C27_scaffold518G00750 [Cucumis melo var. makuwa]|uniref:Uncharacterized protein n=1 Tax=Cucumis melo var. makuwa TaxID=1194695 RepID=A0A5A7UWK8_CUCMM|nr:hypothetical protein E6C27_scaffold518G00750 [Cucumis melo var. makuwa]
MTERLVFSVTPQNFRPKVVSRATPACGSSFFFGPFPTLASSSAKPDDSVDAPCDTAVVVIPSPYAVRQNLEGHERSRGQSPSSPHVSVAVIAWSQDLAIGVCRLQTIQAEPSNDPSRAVQRSKPSREAIQAEPSSDPNRAELRPKPSRKLIQAEPSRELTKSSRAEPSTSKQSRAPCSPSHLRLLPSTSGHGIRELTLKFSGFTAGLIGDNSLLLGWIRWTRTRSRSIAKFQTPMPGCSVNYSYVGRLHCELE